MTEERTVINGAGGTAQYGSVLAGSRLAQHDRQVATTALTRLLDVPRAHRIWVVAAFLMGAIACDALGDPAAVAREVERALDLAASETRLFPFAIRPAPRLTDRRAGEGAASAGLICEVVDLLARAGGPAADGLAMDGLAMDGLAAGRRAADGAVASPCEPLTQGEARVLRYLPSNLSAREIADQLYCSMNTVKTHQRHLYRKLDARSRSQAVERGRALGLLGPSAGGSRPA